ncbi:SapC family protein [Pseudoalteromonas xiamenensis]
MTTTVLLNHQQHKEIKIITRKSAELGDAQMAAYTFVSEFRQIQAHYPILFQKDATNGQFFPVALLGLEPHSNLFLSGAGWEASYVPLSIERLPFSIGQQHDQRVIHIDMSSPKVSRVDGEPLFSEFGEFTPYLERVGQSLELLHQGVQENAHFVAQLLEGNLLESLSLDIELNNGETTQLTGFYTINEDKLNALSDQQLLKLQHEGHLAAIYFVLASHSQLLTLIDRKNRQTQKV